MKRKNGYTLIELIAVIVIIAIISGLVIISVAEMIDANNKKAMKVVAEEILSAVEYEVIENNIDPLNLNGSSVKYILNDYLQLNYSTDNYQSISFYCDECEEVGAACPSDENTCVSYGITVVGKNDWKGYIISGTKADLSFE